MIVFFRMLFVDGKGWNVRSQVAHGLLELELFNQQTAEMLIYAFFRPLNDPLDQSAGK